MPTEPRHYLMFKKNLTFASQNHIIVELKNNGMNNIESSKGEIVMYQPDETIRLEVRVENETVWLTQQQMAELFQTTRNNITLHIGNIFKEGELVDSAVRKESLLTAADGKKYKTKLYNLDVIISVGYRVKSIRGTKFRQWKASSTTGSFSMPTFRLSTSSNRQNDLSSSSTTTSTRPL